MTDVAAFNPVEATFRAAITDPAPDLSERITLTYTPPPGGEGAGAIFGCLLHAQKLMVAVGKDQHNDHHRYAFRGIDDVLDAVHPVLNDAGLIVIPDVIESRVTPVKPGNKVAWYAHVDVAYHLCAIDGSAVTARITSGAIDYDDKATGQALSQAYKAVMIQLLSIPTKDTADPDARSIISEHDAAASQSNGHAARPAASNGNGNGNGHQPPADGPSPLTAEQEQFKTYVSTLSAGEKAAVKGEWSRLGLPATVEHGPHYWVLTGPQIASLRGAVDVPF